MKSLLVNCFLPAWEWGPRGMPSMRYILASYSQDLGIRDNRRLRTIITDPLYQRLWPEVRIDPRRDAAENIGNTKTGWSVATSTGGVGTGLRADRFLVDDPHSVRMAESDAVRELTVRWWREVVPTRLSDPAQSAIVVIMQRVHEGDVSGDIIDSTPGGWTHVMIPMRFDPLRHCRTEHGKDPRTEEGELYWPERFPAWTVERDEKVLGRWGVAAQFQQSPAPRGGGIVQREWWQVWPPRGEEDKWTNESGRLRFPSWDLVIAYLDTAFTQKDENAWCAFTRWGVFELNGVPKVMLASAWRDRPTLRGLVDRVVDSCRKGRVDVLVIENRAGAEWVKQEIMRLMLGGEWSIVLDEPRGDKVARLHSVTPLFEHRVIYAPDREWAEMVISEVEGFPKAKFKDLVDTVSGALGYLRRNGLIQLKAEKEEDDREWRTYRGRRECIAEMYGV